MYLMLMKASGPPNCSITCQNELDKTYIYKFIQYIHYDTSKSMKYTKKTKKTNNWRACNTCEADVVVNMSIYPRLNESRRTSFRCITILEQYIQSSIRSQKLTRACSSFASSLPLRYCWFVSETTIRTVKKTNCPIIGVEGVLQFWIPGFARGRL